MEPTDTPTLDPEAPAPEAVATEEMAPTVTVVPTRTRWRALTVIVGRPTDDGRQFDAITWRDTPLSLLWQRENLPGHEGSVVVGRIDAIYPDPDDASRIWSEGVFDAHGEDGLECLRLVDSGMLKGVSVDASVLDVVIEETGLLRYSGKIGALTVVAFPAFEECYIELLDDEADDDDVMPAMLSEEAPATAAAAPEAEAEAEAPAEEEPAAPAPAAEVDATVDEPVEMEVGRKGKTKTPKRGDRVRIMRGDGDASAEVAVQEFDGTVSLVAAGAPVGAPERSWFERPAFTRRTGFHVIDHPDGRIQVYGHIHGWGECHVGSPAGQCVTVPRGASYAYMNDVDGRGVVCSDGSRVQTGPITLNADHASLSMGWLRAKDHYAHTGLAVADVVCGEDEFGIWVAGAVRPGTPEEQVHVLRASSPSGDWRTIGGRLELVAVLMVNMPGFPALAASGADLPAPLSFRMEDGEVRSLIVRSEVAGADCGCGGHGALDEALDRLANIEAAFAAWSAERRAREADVIADMEVRLGLDPAARIAAMEASLA